MKMNNTTSGAETVENVETPETTEAVETEETVETPDGDVGVDGGEEDVELMTIEELLGLGEEDYEEFRPTILVEAIKLISKPQGNEALT